LDIVIVDVPLNCLLKLFAVERSNVTLPPVPKSEYVSLKVVAVIFSVADIAPVTAISPVWFVSPVIDNILPSNVKFVSTMAPTGELLYVSNPSFVTPVKPNPFVPDVPDVKFGGVVPEVPEVPTVPDVPDVKLGGVVPDVPDVPVCPEVPAVPAVPDVKLGGVVPDVPDVPV
jgi:hypothetical protein